MIPVGCRAVINRLKYYRLEFPVSSVIFQIYTYIYIYYYLCGLNEQSRDDKISMHKYSIFINKLKFPFFSHDNSIIVCRYLLNKIIKTLPTESTI